MGVRFTPIEVAGVTGYTISSCDVHAGDDCCDQLHVEHARDLPAALRRRRVVIGDRLQRIAVLRGKPGKT